MGSLFDKVKKAAQELKEQAPTIARQHGDTIDKGIDRAAAEINKRTGGKHNAKVRQAAERAKRTIGDFQRRGETRRGETDRAAGDDRR
jgi:MT0933-like antitoxin protein